ncbi:MAG: hypothetical protein H0X25_10610 [Acidobacteriales bacterium]|nr:hypothetical protein [Terriglobales bacterium]
MDSELIEPEQTIRVNIPIQDDYADSLFEELQSINGLHVVRVFQATDSSQDVIFQTAHFVITVGSVAGAANSLITIVEKVREWKTKRPQAPEVKIFGFDNKLVNLDEK